jgi:hypothetical protein
MSEEMVYTTEDGRMIIFCPVLNCRYKAPFSLLEADWEQYPDGSTDCLLGDRHFYRCAKRRNKTG